MVLLISSLLTIFSSKESKSSIYSDLPLNPTTTKLAISPVASPIVVPPIGIAVIWISIMVSPNHPGMQSIVIETILIMMSLDFLVMFFIDQITKISILMLFFLILGDALVFLQVALADEMIISAFRHLRIIPR
jgi:multiple antibiotic resistance protein